MEAAPVEYVEDDRLYLDRLRRAAGDSPALSPEETARRELGPGHPIVLAQSEWCPEFEVYMRNRLIMGAMRYGRIGAPGKPKYDRAKSILTRITKYAQTGNKEHLVDIANEAMLEFREPSHPLSHWAAQDNVSLHTEVMK